MSRSTIDEIKKTFEKFSDGRLEPNNFGRALAHAIRDGFLEREFTAKLLDVRPEQIRQKGNTMKGREIQKVAQAIISSRP